MTSRPLDQPAALEVMGSLWRHRILIAQLVKREVAGRYRGSFLGILWSLATPLLMLVVYTFVFGVVFRSRWSTSGTSGGATEFAVVMFAGILVHGLIAECIQRAPSVVVGQPNFVKKVVFPLPTLAWVVMGAALFHATMALGILLVGVLVLQQHVPLTALWLPIVLLPFLLLVVGLVWLLSALGVFLRDLAQMMGIVSSLLLFLAPVFYPLDSVPAAMRPLLYFNPVTFIIEQVRAVLIWGHSPDWGGLLLYLAVAWLVASAGLALFRRASKGFADVL